MVRFVIHQPAFVLLLSLLAVSDVRGLFEWLKRTQPAAATPPPASTLPTGDAPPFEMTVADEKFLAEAKLMELSPLDSCHYRVVAQLKTVCGHLSEEQLAKLGVVLFNCQAEVEGRKTYRCTEEMTIRECTSDMDADTWNAYHIVSNRARSVCYTSRQQHFRRRAELTVNALISTATSQLDAMNELKEGQAELRELTAASLDKLLQGHSALQAQQGELWEGQEQLETSLRSNLERLGQEKALIASGQELVAQLIQGIAYRMENVSEQLKSQGSEVQHSHKAIIEDLEEVRDRAKDIHQKIDHSMLGFLKYQDQTAAYYSDLMDQLERMNSTLGVVLHFLDNMQGGIEEKLHMIQGYLGWAGMSLAALWTCLLHTAYFVLCAVVLAFLRAKVFTRAMLLLAVPLNAVAEVNQQAALDLPDLTLLLLALSLGHWFVGQLLWSCSQIRQTPACLPPPPEIVEQEKEEVPWQRNSPPFPAPSNPQRFPTEMDLICDTKGMDDEVDSLMEPGSLTDQDSIMAGDPCTVALSPCSHRPAAKIRLVPLTGTPNHSTPRLFDWAVGDDLPLKSLGSVFGAVSESRCSSPNHSLASNSSMSGRQLCNGITKTGKACKKRAVLGQQYCNVHQGGYTSYINT